MELSYNSFISVNKGRIKESLIQQETNLLSL
jgi:hypothetical protein